MQSPPWLVSLLYRYGPDRVDARWRWISWGAVVAVGAWVATSCGFGFYVSRFGSYNETYGSLAAIVVVLLWLYLSALVLIIGAEVNAEVEHQTMCDSTTGPERPRGERNVEMADTIGEIG